MYYPDPPFQMYWADEPTPAFSPDPVVRSYWEDAPTRDYWAEVPPKDEVAEEVMNAGIRTLPIYGPMSAPHNVTPRQIAPQANKAIQAIPTGRPVLSLVPPINNDQHNPTPQLPDGGTIVDRRVTLLELEALLDLFLDADDSDGYTRSELTKELERVEAKMKLAGKRVRGNLFERIRNWRRDQRDES